MLINQHDFSQIDLKPQLLKLFFDHSFEYSEVPKFQLAHKKELSQFYIDSKKTTLSSRGMVLVGQLIYNIIADIDVDGIGGLTFGADPISLSTAMTANLSGKKLEVFSVRKKPKTHGMATWIEGNLKRKDKVIIVDDVITTGTSTIRAIDKANEAGFEVLKIIVLVDRQEENGKENIERHGVKVDALFTKDDFMSIYDRRHNKSDTRRAVSR